MSEPTISNRVKDKPVADTLAEDDWTLVDSEVLGVRKFSPHNFALRSEMGGEGGAASLQVSSIAALRALSVSGFTESTLIDVLGYHTPGDGGGGQFRFTASVASDGNGGTVIPPTAGTGRWLRICEKGLVNLAWFGVTGGNFDDVTTCFEEAISIMGVGCKLYIPAGGHLITRTLNLPLRPNIIGEGVNCTTIRFAPLIASPLFDCGDSDNVRIRGLYLYNVLPANAGIRTTGIYSLTGVTELFLEEVNIDGFTQACISMPFAYYVLFSYCRFLSNRNITAKGGSGGPDFSTVIRIPSINTGVFFKCRFSENDQDVAVTGSASLTISCCSFENGCNDWLGSALPARPGWSPGYQIDIGGVGAGVPGDAGVPLVHTFNFVENYVEINHTSPTTAILRLRNCESPTVSRNVWSGSLSSVTRTYNHIEVGAGCSDTVIEGNAFAACGGPGGSPSGKFINVTGAKIVRAWGNTYIGRPEDRGPPPGYLEQRYVTKAEIEPFITAALVELSADFYERSPRFVASGNARVDVSSTSVSGARSAGLDLWVPNTGADDPAGDVSFHAKAARTLMAKIRCVSSLGGALGGRLYFGTRDISTLALAEHVVIDENGDVELLTAGKGITFKTPDGAHRWKLTVNNAGAPVYTMIS